MTGGLVAQGLNLQPPHPPPPPPPGFAPTHGYLPSKRRRLESPGQLLPVLISICMPMRNAVPFLEECLRSVLKQSEHVDGNLLEFSVFNDASTDDSLSVVESWRQRFEEAGMRLVVSSDPPAPTGGGCGYAKNRAVLQSSGKYLCFVDADDIMMPERCAAQVSECEEQDDLLVGSMYIRLPVNATPRYTDWHNMMREDQLILQQYKECTVAMPTWFMARAHFNRMAPNLSDFVCASKFDTGRHLEETLLCKLQSFSIWGGKEAKDLFRSLSSESQHKVSCFFDVDPKKIGTLYNCRESPCRVPIKHFTEAKDKALRPIIICVKPNLTGGAFEENLASLGLTEGEDYWHFG